jgi:cytochrome oxidase assembly protein ShyY1
MCFSFGGGGDSGELEVARAAAARATARANAALSMARTAAAQAAKASRPAGDQESAQRAAESQWRKVVAEGTYTKNFGRFGQMQPASVGYRMLTGEVGA